MSQYFYMLDRAVRHEQAMRYIDVLCPAGRLFKGLLQNWCIIRMAAAAHKIKRWLRCKVILINAEYFLRPILFFGGDLPAEAAGSTKALSFCQIGLAPAPCIFCPLPIEGENGRDADCSKAYEISAD